MKKTIVPFFVCFCLIHAELRAIETKLTAGDGKASQRFGSAAALAGDLLLVGAPGTFADGSYKGAAYLYQKHGDEWVERQKINLPSGDGYDRFGWAVAMSDGRALITARGDSSQGRYSGAALLFEQQTNDSWQQVAQLSLAQPVANDEFGYAADIDGNYAVVGAPLQGGALPTCGAAYVFKFNGSAWVFEAKLTPTTNRLYDNFGGAVAISGNRIIIGASNVPDMDAPAPPKLLGFGKAFVFEKTNGSWQQKAELAPSDGNNKNLFGHTVDLDGDYAIIGAGKDDAHDFDSGSAYIYRRGLNSWIADEKITAPDADSNDLFGLAVAISGEYVVVGAPGADAVDNNSGAVYSFLLSNNNWSQRAKKTPYDAARTDLFGVALAVDARLTVVGAPNKSVSGRNSQGAGYVYDNIDDLALAAELTSFTATQRENAVWLQWVTQTEKDNLGFILERQKEEEGWHVIASYQSHEILRGQGSTAMPTFYEYTDDSLNAGATYHYRLADVNMNGVITWHEPISITLSAEVQTGEKLPAMLTIYPAYPNPFNPQTVLRYKMSRPAFVNISIFDVTGREVRALLAQEMSAGEHTAVWNARNDNGETMSSGVYFIRVRAGDECAGQKVILLP